MPRRMSGTRRARLTEVNDVTGVEAVGDPTVVEHHQSSIGQHVKRPADDLRISEHDAHGLAERGQPGAVLLGDVAAKKLPLALVRAVAALIFVALGVVALFGVVPGFAAPSNP